MLVFIHPCNSNLSSEKYNKIAMDVRMQDYDENMLPLHFMHGT